MNDNFEIKKFTTVNFLNFALGFLGLQFAWQMRIALAEPVTSGLGADPLLYSLIWLAGPFSGMVVQPIIGVLSDNTKSRFGRRRPYLLAGALVTAIALFLFPHSGGISDFISIYTQKFFHCSMPAWGGLLIAAIMIWVIDACINIAQGPYRSLVPDVVPKEQHAQANSYISLAIGLGSVIAMIVAPLLKFAFKYDMSIEAQFVMAGLAFALAMTWTCLTIKERSSIKIEAKDEEETTVEETKKQSFWDSLKEFFLLSPEVKKICTMQFFTWIGMMCLLIYFTAFVIHTVYNLPDASSVSVDPAAMVTARNAALIGLAIFNLICFLIAVPIGSLANKFGNKKVHIVSMLSMAAAYLGLIFFKHNMSLVYVFMGLSGIGWASVCALPFAMLSKYIKPGTEGSVMGIFNIFIAGPQVFVCTLVGLLIQKAAINGGINHHYEYSFIVGTICLILASLVTLTIKE